jgi:hypothetical protein
VATVAFGNKKRNQTTNCEENKLVSLLSGLMSACNSNDRAVIAGIVSAETEKDVDYSKNHRVVLFSLNPECGAKPCSSIWLTPCYSYCGGIPDGTNMQRAHNNAI